MAPSFRSVLFSTLLAGAFAAPAFRGPSNTNSPSDSPTAYNGYNGQSKVQVGEAMNWFQNDKHKSPKSPRISTYQCYQGDISRYPSSEDWLSFDSLWNINSKAILTNNEGDENIRRYIHDSISQVAEESNVDSRFILAAVMQEVCIYIHKLAVIYPRANTPMSVVWQSFRALYWTHAQLRPHASILRLPLIRRCQPRSFNPPDDSRRRPRGHYWRPNGSW